MRFTGDVWNNGVAPQHRSASSKTENLSSVPHDDRGSLFGSQAKSGSAAFAYRNEHLDLVAAYAQRNQGNYFSGKKGQDRYRVYNRYGREESSVAKVYNAGEEVLNSSSETESYLLKATWRIADEHTLDLGYRRYDGRTGEIMPSDIFRFGTAGIYQYPLSEVKIDTYTARYRYLPENNPLVDLSTGLWMTEAKSDMLTSVLAPRSQAYRSDRNWTRQDNRRIGGDLNNVARFETDFGDFKLDLGGSFQVEDIQPQKSVVTTLHDINANRTLRGRHPPGIRPQRQARVQAGRAPDAMGRRPLQPLQQQGQRHLRLAAARGSRHALHHGEQARLLRLDDVVPRPERPVHRRHRSPPQQRHRHQQHQQSVRRHSLRRVRPGQRDSPSLAGHQRGHRLQLQQEGQQPRRRFLAGIRDQFRAGPGYLRLRLLYRRPASAVAVRDQPGHPPGRAGQGPQARAFAQLGDRCQRAARQPVGRRRLGGDQAGLLQQHHQELHHPLLRSGPDGPDDLQQHRQLPHQRSRTAIALRRRAGVRRPVGDLLPEDRDLRRRLRRQAARRRQPLPAHREHAELHAGQLHGLLYQHAEPAAAGDQPDRRPALLRPGP